MQRRFLIIVLAVLVVGIAPGRGQGTYQEEADQLAALLNWRPGSVVAEIGASQGQMTLAAAKHVGEAGRVLATELDPTKLAHLQELAAKQKNITVLKAAEEETNLPPECCDSIFMRLVYHHLTKPVPIDDSLFRSLKPGGRLGVIDEDPPADSKRPEGVPENRGGHGIPQKILIDELTSAGFQVVKTLNEWPSRDAFHPIYCVVFRKPVG
jgi:ubiquinone/menaquinone biosynthesis C-methylase UbiE